MLRFRPKSTFITETVWYYWSLTEEVLGFRSVRVTIDDLVWLWKAGREGPIFFRRISVRMLLFDQQPSNSACWTYGRGTCFSRVNHVPNSKEPGSTALNFFGESYLYVNNGANQCSDFLIASGLAKNWAMYATVLRCAGKRTKRPVEGRSAFLTPLGHEGVIACGWLVLSISWLLLIKKLLYFLQDRNVMNAYTSNIFLCYKWWY